MRSVALGLLLLALAASQPAFASSALPASLDHAATLRWADVLLRADTTVDHPEGDPGSGDPASADPASADPASADPGEGPQPVAAPAAQAPPSGGAIDDRLADALHLLDDQIDRDGVPYPDAIRGLHVAIGLAAMAPGTLATYDRRARRITVTERLLQEDPTAVATVIVHELVHVRDKDLIASGQASIDCLDQEVRAFEAQSRVWRSFWTDPPSRTPIERELTSAARIYEQRGVDGLREAITRVPTYQQQCPNGAG